MTELLETAPEVVRVAGRPYVLVRPEDLLDAQRGYSVGGEGEDLTGEAQGDWKSAWIVIGSDEDLGDPLFVDLSSDHLPVFTADHGTGLWEPLPVSESLASFVS